MSLARKTMRRRGISLIETLVGSGLLVMLTSMLVAVTRLQGIFWHESMAVTDAQTTASRALHQLAPVIRSARSVVLADSDETRLTLQLPAYDASGELITPLQDGDVVSFYLSDTTGDPDAVGNILWRSVNGVPDADWSMAESHRRITLPASDGLAFSYEPPDNPRLVTVSIAAAMQSGTRTGEYVTELQVLLRNRRR